jgi:lipopolysaccharide export system protein LptA
MSPFGYVALIPAGLITVSVWWVRREDASFNSGPRTCHIQVLPNLPHVGAGNSVTVDQLDPTLRLDAARYGATPNGGNLGRDVVFRPLGERPGAAPDWLAAQKPAAPPAATPPHEAKISDYHDAPPPADPLETAIATESGYDIVADEVTKIEMGKNRVIFTGHVRMSSPQFYLTSNQLIVYLGKDKSSMNSAEAQGDVNVRLTGVPPERACRSQSGRALYDPNQDTLTLLDWPKIKTQSQEQIAATAETKMTIITKTGKMNTEGKALTRVSKSFVGETTAHKK